MKTRKDKINRNQRNQKGAGMIEVLATVVILAIGLLGIAALQLMSKRSGFESVQRTTASTIAMGIIERMRANSAALNTYAGTMEAPAGDVVYVNNTPLNPNCTTGSPCTAVQLANNDIWTLEQKLDGRDVVTAANESAGGLISPRACITSLVPAAQLNANGQPDRSGAYQVTIVWRGSSKLSNPKPANICGMASGAYDDNPGDNSFRRILVVNAYIAET